MGVERAASDWIGRRVRALHHPASASAPPGQPTLVSYGTLRLASTGDGDPEYFVGEVRVDPSSIRLAEQRDRSLSPPTAVHHEAADHFAEAVALIASGNLEAGRRLLADMDDTPFRARWEAAGWEWKWRHSPADHVEFVGERAPAYIPSSTKRLISERDGWRCRFCDLRLLDDRIVAILRKNFPAELPWGNRDLDQHAVLAGLRLSPEHVVARSSGGSNDPSNLVSACWPCQFQKGNCSLDELWLEDPRDRDPVVDDWNGLVSQVDDLRRALADAA